MFTSDPTILTFLYAREVMRRVGFTADDIYFTVSPSGAVIRADTGDAITLPGTVIACVVRAQGKEFVWTLGATELAVAEIEPEYMRACEAWNAYTGPVPDEFFKSQPFQDRMAVIQALVAKGFALPTSIMTYFRIGGA